MSRQLFSNQIKAGTTFKLTAYPASDWTIDAYLRGASAIDLQSRSQGNMHVFNVSANISKDYKAEHYGFSLRAVNSGIGEVEELESGMLEIKADLVSISENADLRSHAQKILIALEAVIEGRTSLIKKDNVPLKAVDIECYTQITRQPRR